MKKTLLIIPALLVLMLVWAAPAHGGGLDDEGETYRHYGASSCVPNAEGLAVRTFGVDIYEDGELVESKSWTEHVSDPGCTLPTSDPQEDVAPPAAPVEAEAAFTG